MGERKKKTIKVTFPDGRVEKFTSLVDLANQYFDIKKLNYFYNRTQYKGFPFVYKYHVIDRIKNQITMIETKEQIITELINELIEWNDSNKWNHIQLTAKLNSMLPTETPEKIAERKAVEILNENGLEYVGDSTPVEILLKNIKQMLIEALLTDIKK